MAIAIVRLLLCEWGWTVAQQPSCIMRQLESQVWDLYSTAASFNLLYDTKSCVCYRVEFSSETFSSSQSVNTTAAAKHIATKPSCECEKMSSTFKDS